MSYELSPTVKLNHQHNVKNNNNKLVYQAFIILSYVPLPFIVASACESS